MRIDSVRQQPLSTQEALQLLGTVRMGRIAFTLRALPAIRPVNHLLDDGAIIIRTHADAAVMSAVDQVVAYEADLIDQDTHTGWSVIVTGVAQLVTGSDDVQRYQRTLHPWVDRYMHHAIRIEPQIVTGYQMVNDAAA